ncbi:MAG: hypothetical protein EXR75_09680 [Myxococcales bacterium]|nr:hypothetical protein [Myxococcales bacterium]
MVTTAVSAFLVAALLGAGACSTGDETGAGGAAATTTTTSVGGTGGAGGSSTESVGGAGGSSTASVGGAGGTGGGTGGMGGMPGVCGDGSVDAGEECDDANVAPLDGCDAACQFEATCPNDTVEPGETCDDNNNALGDGCDAGCQLEPGGLCGGAVDLNDPALPSQGSVTIYDGTTVGSTNKKSNITAPSCGNAADSLAVLHKYVMKTHAKLAVETKKVGGDLSDTQLWAYLDCQDRSKELACDEDGGVGDLSRFHTSQKLPAGTAVFIAVAAYTSAAAGPYQLRISEIEDVASSGTCAAATPIGTGSFQGETKTSDASVLAGKCVGAAAPEAVFSITTTKTADLHVALVKPTDTSLGAYMLGALCNSAFELDCTSSAFGTLEVKNAPPATYYVVVDGDGAGEAGLYGFEVTVNEELAAGDSCSAGDAFHHCGAGTECTGKPGQAKCTAPLLTEQFTAGLGAFTVVDANSDMVSWYACVPPGCSDFNYTGSKSQGGFAIVLDSPTGELDGEALVSPELDATALANVTLEFDHDYYDELACDEKISVQTSLDGIAWTDVKSWTGTVAATHEKFDLSAMVAGKKFRVRFLFDDDSTGINSCYAVDWRIDDVLIY